MIGYVEICECLSGKYVHYIAPNTNDPEVIEPLRLRVRDALRESRTSKVILDFRDVDVPSFKLIDVDTLGHTFKADIPECRRLVLLCQDSVLEAHFERIISCSDQISVARLPLKVEAEKWLFESD